MPVTTVGHDQLLNVLRPLSLGLHPLWAEADGTRDLMMFEDQVDPGQLTAEGRAIVKHAADRATNALVRLIPPAQEAGGDLYETLRQLRLLVAATAGVAAGQVPDEAETLFVVWQEARALHREAIGSEVPETVEVAHV